MQYMKNEATEIKHIYGGVTAPRGYVAAGIHCGIKKDSSPDLAILFSKAPCSAFAVFTKNRVKGHSLLLSMENIGKGLKHCIFINSGNANACIGDRGMQDARTIALTCAQKLGISAHEVLTASTGVIGSPLPMDKILPGIESACQNLSAAGGSDAARAIMTTDTFSKEYSVEVELSGHTVTIGGMAKGSGMIHPNMATMIAVITTDADIESGMMEALVRESADCSFNRISIDGDTSVCDTMMCLANGLSGYVPESEDSPDFQKFKAAFLLVCTELSKKIVMDGEGATKLLEINVINAIDQTSAEKAARSIANSPLVKTAFYGEDANWGRILTAAGYSGASFKPELTSISIGSLLMFDKGTVVGFDETEASRILKNKEISITVDFGEGSFNERIWTCDLSHGYIDINAHYRT